MLWAVAGEGEGIVAAEADAHLKDGRVEEQLLGGRALVGGLEALLDKVLWGAVEGGWHG